MWPFKKSSKIKSVSIMLRKECSNCGCVIGQGNEVKTESRYTYQDNKISFFCRSSACKPPYDYDEYIQPLDEWGFFKIITIRVNRDGTPYKASNKEPKSIKKRKRK